MKKLRFNSEIDEISINVEKDDRFFDNDNLLLAKEHYGHYVMTIKKNKSLRFYLSQDKYFEFIQMRKKNKEYNYPNKTKTSSIFLYSRFIQYKKFIELSLLELIDTQSYSIISRRIKGMFIFLEEAEKLELNLNNLNDINNEMERNIYLSIDKMTIVKKDKIALRTFFGFIEKINLSFNAINYFDNLTYSPIKALPSIVIHQLEYSAITEIKEIIKDVNNYQNWMKEFEEIDLFNLANLAHTYYYNVNSQSMKLKSLNLKINEVSVNIHNINLKQWKYRRGNKYEYADEKQKLKHKELLLLGDQGININIEDEKMYAFWFKELIPDFPFENKITSKYSSVFTVSYIVNKYYFIFQKEIRFFYRKISPSVHELYPLVLLILIREGINSEVLSDWKVKLKEGANFILGDETPVCLSIYGNKGRGNKKIHTSIDNKSEQKLFIDFYLDWLKPIYLLSNKNNFLQYYTRNGRGSPFKVWDPNSFFIVCNSTNSFFDKYKIYDRNNIEIKKINHKRIRPYTNYADHLRGYSNFLRQIKKGHNNIDTLLHYENSSEWSEQKMHNIAKTQELLVDIFQGKIKRGEHFSVELFQPGLYADCANTKEPTYYGAKQLKADEDCTNWRKCLTHCNKACVIPNIHGKAIYAWIEYMEKEKERFYNILDWEKEYILDYEAAKIVFNDFTDEEKLFIINDYSDYSNIVKMRFKEKSKKGVI